MGPAIAVVSCGRDNRYGHPHPEVLARLKARCKTVYQTALDGTLSFGFTRRGVQLLR